MRETKTGNVRKFPIPIFKTIFILMTYFLLVKLIQDGHMTNMIKSTLVLKK